MVAEKGQTELKRRNQIKESQNQIKEKKSN